MFTLSVLILIKRKKTTKGIKGSRCYPLIILLMYLFKYSPAKDDLV